MKNLSLKLRDDVFKETEKITRKLKIPRNAYINKAVDFYNKVNKRAELKKKLWYESQLVAEESLNVLYDLEQLED